MSCASVVAKATGGPRCNRSKAMYPYPDQDQLPYSAIVRIVAHWSNGSMSFASGALVGPNDVLTAAHVLHQPGVTLSGLDILPAFRGPADESAPDTTGHTAFGGYSTN